MDKNRRFHELIGKCWHEANYSIGTACICLKCKKEFKYNPDYISDPRLVLREMMQRRDWTQFVDVIGMWLNRTTGIMSEHILLDCILDQTGLLLEKAIKWLEKDGKQ